MRLSPANLFRVFVSSPGDVAEERAVARRVVESVLPQKPALKGRVSFEIVAWDHPEGGVAMPAGLTPQEAVNRGLPKPSECDLTVVILWSRMGTPLPAGLEIQMNMAGGPKLARLKPAEGEAVW